jgi:hypothetical protein
MNRFGDVVFHAVAFAAMLVHLLLVGPLSLLALYLRPEPGTDFAAIVLKGLIAGSWLGLGWAGIRAWTHRSWAVAAVPFLSFSIAWVVILIGNETIGWTLPIGY